MTPADWQALVLGALLVAAAGLLFLRLRTVTRVRRELQARHAFDRVMRAVDAPVRRWEGRSDA